jgi:platelet-activating factor acetylhydrolase
VHASFSDFPVTPIIRKKSARPLLETISTLSLAFLDDRLEEALVSEVSTTDMEIEVIGLKKDGKPKRKLIGNVGDVIIQ